MSTTDDATMNMMQLKYVAVGRGGRTISMRRAVRLEGCVSMCVRVFSMPLLTQPDS